MSEDNSETGSDAYEVVDQEQQPVAGITRSLTMATLSEASDEIPGLIGWLSAHGYQPAGPPFLRYLVIDMAAEMVVQAGVSVAQPIDGDGRVEADVLPGGRYLTSTHTGPYDGLYQATVGLLAYAGQHGLRFDKEKAGRGEVWASRLEYYETNPAEQPDPSRWVTRLAFKLAEEDS